MECTCVGIVKEDDRHIRAYSISDGSTINSFYPDELKGMIKSGKITVNNLILTKDNRLLDRAALSSNPDARKHRIPVTNLKAGKENKLDKAFPYQKTLYIEDKTKFRISGEIDRLVMCRFKDLRFDVKSFLTKGIILGSPLIKEIQPGLYQIRQDKNIIITANCGVIYLPEDCSEMFAGCWADRISFKGVSYSLHTCDYSGIFYMCKAKQIDLSTDFINSEYDTILDKAFYGCARLEKLNLGKSFHIGSIGHFYEMFDGCKNLSLIKTDDRAFETDSILQFANDCGLIDSIHEGRLTDKGINTAYEWLGSFFVPNEIMQSCVVVTPNSRKTLKQSLEAMAESIFELYSERDDDSWY